MTQFEPGKMYELPTGVRLDDPFTKMLVEIAFSPDFQGDRRRFRISASNARRLTTYWPRVAAWLKHHDSTIEVVDVSVRVPEGVCGRW